MRDYLIGCDGDLYYHKVQAKTLTSAKTKCSKFYHVQVHSLLKVAIKDGDDVIILSSKRGHDKWADKL